MKKDTVDYEKLIISIISQFQNKSLLKRVYRFSEYLFVYKDGSEEDSVNEQRD